MADNLFLKAALYTASTLVPWERVNYDAHYLSQVCLGWWMGYLAVRACRSHRLRVERFAVIPMVSPEMTGIGFEWRM